MVPLLPRSAPRVPNPRCCSLRLRQFLVGRQRLSGVGVQEGLGEQFGNRAMAQLLDLSTGAFVGQDLEIVKLTVAEAIEIQTSVSEAEASEDPESNLKILLRVIQFGALELKEMTLEDLKEFPMQELTQLSGEIMKYSGMAVDK